MSEVMKIKRKLLWADFELNFAWVLKIMGPGMMAVVVHARELNLDLIIS